MADANTNENPIVRACRKAVSSRWFRNSVTILIVLSAIIVGLDTDPVLPSGGPLFSLALTVLSAIFAVEILVRIIAESPTPLHFFRSPWNLFDFCVVVMCLLPGMSKVSLVLRLGRVIRVLRVVTIVPGLRIIVTAMINSIPAVANVGLLMLVHFYIYGVLGVAFFGHNDPGHFGTIARAVLTLFGVLTLEGWVDVMTTEMIGNTLHASSMPSPDAVNHAAPMLSPIYFVTFILIGTIIIMNLFVGVVINAIQEAHEASQRDGLATSEDGQTVAPSAEARPTPATELKELEQQLDGLRGRLANLRERLPDSKA